MKVKTNIQNVSRPRYQLKKRLADKYAKNGCEANVPHLGFLYIPLQKKIQSRPEQRHVEYSESGIFNVSFFIPIIV